MDRCIFCEIIKGNIQSRKIHESEYSIALLDAFPLVEGHTLLISKEHKTKIQDLSISENNDIFSLMHVIVNTVEKTLQCESTLIAIHNGKEAGQEIPHVHIHIVPANREDKTRPIHSMFTKKDIPQETMDSVQNKLINNLKNIR
jgi:histidine triad (HIT) family protein